MRQRFRILSVLALLVAAWLWSSPARAGDSVTVIVSPEHQDVSLNRRELLSIYLGRITQWPDGSPIRVFAMPDGSALHASFCRQRLSTYPYVLRNTWDKLVYTGTGFSPLIVNSEQEMRRRVETTPGAIGYVSMPDDNEGAGGARNNSNAESQFEGGGDES